MNAQLCEAAFGAECVESSWFGGRFVAATTQAAHAALATFQTVWNEQSQDTNRAHAFALMIDVNSRTLKDIGAPDWMIARANERRHSHTIHLLELFRS